MFRAFRRYSPHAPYDGIPLAVDADSLPLDQIDCAGKLLVRELRACACGIRGLSFAQSIDIILSEEVMNGALQAHATFGFKRQCTPKKWRQHLAQLKEAGILKEMSKAEILCFSRYFAVPKSDELTARAILNLKAMSKCFKSPPPVNLPEVSDVLRNIATGGMWWIVADWRHYFHQFKLHPTLWRHTLTLLPFAEIYEVINILRRAAAHQRIEGWDQVHFFVKTPTLKIYNY